MPRQHMAFCHAATPRCHAAARHAIATADMLRYAADRRAEILPCRHCVAFAIRYDSAAALMSPLVATASVTPLPPIRCQIRHAITLLPRYASAIMIIDALSLDAALIAAAMPLLLMILKSALLLL